MTSAIRSRGTGAATAPENGPSARNCLRCPAIENPRVRSPILPPGTTHPLEAPLARGFRPFSGCVQYVPATNARGRITRDPPSSGALPTTLGTPPRHDNRYMLSTTRSTASASLRVNTITRALRALPSDAPFVTDTTRSSMPSPSTSPQASGSMRM